MENNMFGIKEMYECILKATYDIEVGGMKIKAGQPVAIFDTLQVADIRELKSHVDATGGYGNQSWVTWDNTKEIGLTFSQGILSHTHLALMGNSFIRNQQKVSVPKIETLEIGEEGYVELQYEPEEVFVWKAETGEQITTFIAEANRLSFTDVRPYTDIKVYYTFSYDNAKRISIGQQLIKGYLELTAKTRLKDDITGKTVTGIMHMPKVKLMSDFSIRLGNDAPPAVGRFAIVGYPTGSKGSEKVMDFISLNDDIDSDF